MNITFGKKIPISATQIYNKNTKEFEKAILYELDGRDESDLEELVSDAGAEWRYKYEMSVNLFDKIQKLPCKDLSDLKRYVLEHDKFYVLKTEDDKLAAICETQGAFNFADVHYLERNRTMGYSLCGQAILASIAKHMLKKPEASLEVSDPVKNARDFYIKSCGFKASGGNPESHKVEMDEQGMKDFVNRFEQTVAPIIDITV